MNVLIIGGGLTGLAAALFLARRDHTATILERDAAPPPDDPQAAFDEWDRRGVAQRRQSHNFLARSSKVLDAEAPDVKAALLNAGAYARPARWRDIALEDPNLIVLCARRLMYEAVFRQIVAAEPNVEIRCGVHVDRLVAQSDGIVPHVTGIRARDGMELHADFVVDASGRHSQAPKWLADIGARAIPEKLQECGFFYLTRWYHLHDGETFPDALPPVVANLEYLNAMVFAGDSGFYSFTTIMSVRDPLRHAIRDPRAFDRVLGEIPLLEPWLARGTPVSEAEPLTRIDNRYRKLVDADGPVVTGFALLGDSSVHTNPTNGRGVSLGFAHAQHLAETVDRARADPVQYATDFARWTSTNIGVWYNSQVANDAAAIARLEASLDGRELPQPSDPTARYTRALMDLTATDPEVGAAFARVAHLLITPAELVRDASVNRKVMAYLATDPDFAQPRSAGPKRAEFEALVA